MDGEYQDSIYDDTQDWVSDSFGEVADSIETGSDDFQDYLVDYIPPFFDNFDDQLIDKKPYWPENKLDKSGSEGVVPPIIPPSGDGEQDNWSEIPEISEGDDSDNDGDCWVTSAVYTMESRVRVFGEKSLTPYYSNLEELGWQDANSWTGFAGDAIPFWVKFPPIFGIYAPGDNPGSEAYACYVNGVAFPFQNVSQWIAGDQSANRWYAIRQYKITGFTLTTTCGIFPWPGLDGTNEGEDAVSNNPCCDKQQEKEKNQANPKKKLFNGDSGLVFVPSGHVILAVDYEITPPSKTGLSFAAGNLGQIHLSGSWSFDRGERVPFSFLKGRLHPPNDRCREFAYTLKTGYTIQGKLMYYKVT